MKRGFTIIELLIVIAILLILAAIAAPAIMRYNDKNKGEKVEDIYENLPPYETRWSRPDLYRDPETGCEYLVFGSNKAAIPRMGPGDKQICKERK